MDAFAAWLTPWFANGSPLLVPLVLLGGLVTAINPCCLPMYPAALGYLGQAGLRPGASGKSGRLAFAFVCGMAAATTAMGIATAAFGWVFGQLPGPLRLVLALLPLLMGLDLLGVIRLRLSLSIRPTVPAFVPATFLPRIGRAFTVGFLLALAIAPCATPILIGILSAIAMNGSMMYGGTLMFLYGLGTGLPLLVIGKGANSLADRLISPQTRRVVNGLLGGLLIAVSVFLIWNT